MSLLKLTGKIIKYLILAGLLAVVILLVIVFSSYKELKAAGLDALAGKRSLEVAASAAKNREWNQAASASEEAGVKIESALASLDKVKSKMAFSKIRLLRQQVNDLEYLLKTAELISNSLNRGLPIAQKLDELYANSAEHRFASLSLADKEEFFRLIYESEPELNGLRANLDLAYLNLGKIKRIGVLWPVYSQISDLRQEIEQASHLLSQAAPILRLLPAFAGYPSRSEFLVIMHNNDELRPGGGFIGVFGLLDSENGDIISLQTYDSYHLDMPAVGKWIMEPPAPIKTYMSVQNWYLRDANWSPDWPTSARKILEIYAGESNAVGKTAPDFTGVIGITPEFVSDLLRLVGPIEIDGETYTPENLQPLLQYTVEVAYIEQGIPSWDRKDVVNELLAELKSRLFALETGRLPELFAIFENNTATKDVQLYFPNPAWQSLVVELAADGSVKSTEKDYLLVVDANLAAFKSDAVMRKSIDYVVSTEGTKEARAELNLGYQHDGGFDWRTTRYRSYTRVYAPRGSRLLEIKALDKANLDADSITSYDDVSLDKTVFGFFFSVEPGTKGTVRLQYELPERIASSLEQGNYELLVQHQAGRRTERFQAVVVGETHQANLDRDIVITN